MRADQEIWINAIAGRIQVRKFDARGQLGAELVGSGRKVFLTPEERQINQELAASHDLDVFANGALQPVKLLDGADEAAIVTPNHISEDDMRSLFSEQWKKFDARIAQISNPATLKRLLELAEEVDAKVRQVDVIRQRLDEVEPVDITEIEAGGRTDDLVRGGIKPVTPR